jgi:D-galactarolactone cycloisomerase
VPILDKIELHFVSVPLPAPFSPAWIPGNTRTQYAFTLLRLITADGIEGWSAFPTAGRERTGIGDELSDLFLGHDPTDIDFVHERLKIMAVGGNRNWWIEPAFWDIKAKAAGLPLYKLLGGKDHRLRLYASSGEVKSSGARRDEGEARLAEGFDTLKIRVHDWDERVDIAHIQDIAHAMQGRMQIAVDCNQAFRLTQFADAPLWDLARAKRFADAAADAGLAWVEEPLFMEWYDDMATLAAYSRVPIAGAELHTSGYPELKYMIEKRCYHIFQADAMWAGGVLQCTQVAALCRTHGLKFTAHSWSTGIGFIVNAHVMAASGFADEMPYEYPYSPPGWTIQARDTLLTEPWQHDRGWFTMPTAAGLGFDIDQKALSKLGRCFFRADRTKRVWMPEVLMSVTGQTQAKIVNRS